MKKERENFEEIGEYKKCIAAVSNVIHWRIPDICEGIDKTIWKINSAVEHIWSLLRA